MKNCCTQAGSRVFAARYPYAGHIEEDDLTAGLLDLCDRWRVRESADLFYVRSTSSLGIGVNAETGWIQCDTCGDSVPYAFIGSRLLNFIWRVNMVVATYYDAAPASLFEDVVTLSGSADWPHPEHVEQLRIAISLYFGDSPLLSTEGLVQLNQQIFTLAPGPALVHQHIVDFAELFVLLHELQHRAPLAQSSGGDLSVQMPLLANVPISPKRANWWTAELTHDASAAYILLVSATSVLAERSSLQPQQARAQAGSLVLAGADSALHVLQILEETRFGVINLESAATSSNFVRHPPSFFRRNHLSQVGYHLFTGKSSESLLRREFTEEWAMVAANVASQMKAWDLLLDASRQGKLATE